MDIIHSPTIVEIPKSTIVWISNPIGKSLIATTPNITLPAPIPITPSLDEIGVTSKPRKMRNAATNSGKENKGMDMIMYSDQL
jgi:hypothetical protein